MHELIEQCGLAIALAVLRFVEETAIVFVHGGEEELRVGEARRVDRGRNVARKIELYLERGALVVLDVVPKRHEIVAHAPSAEVRVYRAGDTFAHTAVPGLTFDVAAYFASGEIPDGNA